MTVTMATLEHPEEIVIDPKEGSHDLRVNNDESKRGPDSPDCVDGLAPSMAADVECEPDKDKSGAETQEKEEEGEEDNETQKGQLDAAADDEREPDKSGTETEEIEVEEEGDEEEKMHIEQLDAAADDEREPDELSTETEEKDADGEKEAQIEKLDAAADDEREPDKSGTAIEEKEKMQKEQLDAAASGEREPDELSTETEEKEAEGEKEAQIEKLEASADDEREPDKLSTETEDIEEKGEEEKETQIEKLDAVASGEREPDKVVIETEEKEAEEEKEAQMEKLDAAVDSECESDESGTESEEEEEEEEEAQMEELDASALLEFSKSRLEKTPQPQVLAAEPVEVNDEEDDTSDNENFEEDIDAGDAAEESTQLGETNPVAESSEKEKKMDADTAVQIDKPVVKDQAYFLELAMNDSKEAEVKDKMETDPAYLLKLSEKKVAEAEAKAKEVKDQAYFLELAMNKSKEAEVKEKMDMDPAYLLKLSEKKVAEAEAKAKEDEEATGENLIKPAMAAKPNRSENSELWALLNYSKMRLEKGATPNVGKKSSSKNGSVRGDDNMSVSSKLSKSSKRSLGSKKSRTKVAVVGGPGNLGSPPNKGEERTDAPFPNITDNCDASVGGSVSLESETKNSVANEDESDNSDDEEESSDEEEEEEDELPDFLKDEEDVDPEEAKMLYEAAKYKAASILSVTEDKLTDVQMLQAIAIAEEAANKGDEKFSTKRSLFKLNEAKIEDLKSFLNLATSPKNSQLAAKAQEKEVVGWGIGRGRLMKKLGSVVQDFREKCDEIDDKKKLEREAQPSNKEMLSAAMIDLKAQIEEYEKIVTSKKG